MKYTICMKLSCVLCLVSLILMFGCNVIQSGPPHQNADDSTPTDGQGVLCSPSPTQAAPSPMPTDPPKALQEKIEAFGMIYGNNEIISGHKTVMEPDLGLVTSIEPVSYGAEDGRIKVSFKDAPDIELKGYSPFLPTSKIAYADLTGDGEPEIIILSKVDLGDRMPLDGGYWLFVLKKENEQYHPIELPQLDSIIMPSWGPYYPDDERAAKFPEDPRYKPLYRVPSEFIAKRYGEDSRIFEYGDMITSVDIVSNFQVVEQDGKHLLLAKQVLTGYYHGADRWGYLISVLAFDGDVACITEKQLILND